MTNTKFYIKIIICTSFMLSCFHKNPDTEVSPDTLIKDRVDKKNDGDNAWPKNLNVEKFKLNTWMNFILSLKA